MKLQDFVTRVKQYIIDVENGSIFNIWEESESLKFIKNIGNTEELRELLEDIGDLQLQSELLCHLQIQFENRSSNHH